MIYGYLIENVRALSELFKVNQTPKHSADGHFTAYRVRHPEFPARRALVLCGISATALKANEMPESVGREIHVTTEEGQLYWYNDGDKEPLEVLGVDTSPHLSELISPVPWVHEAPHNIPVIFWLRDLQLMPEIVRRSLYLNNDRVQVATLRHDGDEVMMVRIEAPSYYLLAWCEEQDPDDLDIFYPMTEGPGLYVEWRYVHPLADLWRRAWTERGEQWAFFPHDGHRRTIEKPEWRSIYDITDFSMEVDEGGVWQQVSEEVESFEISLALTPRHEPAPVEMLLLSADERHKLEDFLALTDDEEVDKLEISAQRDASDKQWFFVREKHRGDGLVLTELGGRGFSRYKGFDNLLLPVEMRLEPQLRRDQYKKLFELDPSTITFVVPTSTDVMASEAQRVKVKKTSFEPLSHFVDHVVHFEREALESILADSIFDLDIYKQAPSRPDMTRPGADASKKPRPRDASKKDEKSSRDRMQDKSNAIAERKRRQAQRRNQAANAQEEEVEAIEQEAAPTELELVEAEVERDLIRQGPLPQLWEDLFEVKRRRDMWLEASVCAIEGMWSTLFPADQGSINLDEPDTLNRFKQGFSEAIAETGGEPEELDVVSRLFGATAEGAPTSEQVMQLSGEMRSLDTKLGKKVRWLAWRELLVRTQDVRTQEDVRETLLTELNQNGLLTQDTATFLRERILKDPELELENDDFERGSDNSYVLQNIEAIESAINHLQTTKIRVASKASLARIFAGMGIHARARDLIGDAIQGMEETLAEVAALSDARSWATRVEEFFRGRPDGAQELERPERWHVWVALNAHLIYQRIEPSRAEEAKRAYDFLFGQLAAYEKEELRKTAESLEERIGQSNIAEFLALDTRSFFSSRDLPDEMTKVVEGLRHAHKRRKDEQIGDLVSRGIRLAMRELNDSPHPSLETVARLILEMVEGLRRLKWEKEQRPVEQFEQFVRDLPLDPPSPDASRLYFAVLHCAAARALMDLGREKEAMTRLVEVMHWVGEDYMQVLDFVDLVKKEVLLAIELAPRTQRSEALQALMQTLREQERLEIGDDPVHPGVGFEMPFQAYELIQMIDHTLEAAISNEKLVLRRLRDFEEREEARIRYWVQRDQPAAS